MAALPAGRKPWAARYRAAATRADRGRRDSATCDAAQAELTRGLGGLLGVAPALERHPTRDGAIVFGTPAILAIDRALHLDLRSLGREGYLIRSASIDGHRATVIAANEDIGVLYGVFHFLRLLQTRQPLEHSRSSVRAAACSCRVLDHWDNLDGTVERGYAGASIWDWQKLPDYLDPRYTDYARACASIGINGSGAQQRQRQCALSLTPLYLRKGRGARQTCSGPMGCACYLTARFSAPMEIGGLKTADPLDPAVRAWWRAKVDEIYRLIPDFGGFLVKANSEGQPGPQDYGRSHADGANMLAEALAPHGGIVMWRAFVYSQEQPEDRAKQAYDEFMPLDGKFQDNVLLQVKNGADRLPAARAVPSAVRRHAAHAADAGGADHQGVPGVRHSPGVSRAAVRGGARLRHLCARAGLDGAQGDRRLAEATATAWPAWPTSAPTATGAARIFDQANWYAFGRLAWDPDLAPQPSPRNGCG